uniref:Uncharacterized protein n=1 Tax=Nelumbo nucifera TaxID=4432 RepID=A0A822XHR9_NELNU|nr:TPA_asm: hypothetical protein HUJ06_020686 [Nelumbo nucifera]
MASSGEIKPFLSRPEQKPPVHRLACYRGLQSSQNKAACYIGLGGNSSTALAASSGAIKPLVRALKTGTATAKENANCALLRLSHEQCIRMNTR